MEHRKGKNTLNLVFNRATARRPQQVVYNPDSSSQSRGEIWFLSEPPACGDDREHAWHEIKRKLSYPQMETIHTLLREGGEGGGWGGFSA